MRIVLFTPTFLLWSAATAAASETLTPQLAVETALERHPLLRAALAGVEAAEASREVARSRLWPSLEFAEEVLRSTNPVVVFSSKLGQERFGTSDFALDALNRPDPFGHVSTRLALRQSVWDGGREHLGVRAATAGLSAAERALARARQEVAFGAVRAFWDAFLAEESLRVAEAAEREAEANAHLARERVEEGEAIPSDGLQAEARLRAVSALRARARGAVEVSRAGLRRALGLAGDAVFALAAPEAPACPEGDLASWQVEAIGRRPDLAALRFEEEQARLGVGIARSGRLPVLDLAASAEWNGRSVLGTDGDNWTIGASLRLPLFDGFQTRSRTARARAERDARRARVEAMEESVRFEVSAAWADCRAAAERLRAADSAVELAEEGLRIVRERYSEGMALMVELLAAEAARTQALGDRAAARHELAVAAAALELTSGREPAAGTEAGEPRGGGNRAWRP